LPLYDYQCRACSKVTEVRHGFREAYDGTCPDCGGDLARVFNPAGIVFKGSGFYINDSRKPAATESSAASTSTPSTPATPSAPAASPPSGSDSGPKKSESAA
jgi:putative FmdB family regulatory protein